MLNYLWAAMIFVGVVTGACTGRMQEVSAGFVDASAEAVKLCIATAGIVALWTGMLKIAEKAGLLQGINRCLFRCFISFFLKFQRITLRFLTYL